jgi:WD40 repeat protein
MVQYPRHKNEVGMMGQERIRPALIYRDHCEMIELAAWSPVSTTIASCGLDACVRVWDAASGKTNLVYSGHRDLVRDIAFSPDGENLATCSEDGQVHVWETATGIPKRLYHGHRRPPISLCWSPDGTLLASADETAIHLWPAWEHPSRTERSLTFGRAHECIFTAVCWSHDAERLLTASESCVYQWDAATGVLLGLCDYGDPLVAIALSPDGSRLAIAQDDASVQVVCARTGVAFIKHSVKLDASWGLSWSPCGKYLASCGYASVEVWDALSGATLFTYHGHEETVSSTAWSPDGGWIVSTGVDGTAQVWAPPVR